MARLNIERQERLEPERIAHAVRRMAAYSRNRTDDMRTKTLYKADGDRLKIDRFPCFHITGSIAGMKRMFYGKDALLVRCGSWIYNVSKEPRIYHIAH